MLDLTFVTVTKPRDKTKMKIKLYSGLLRVPAPNVGQTTLEQINGLVGHLDLVVMGQVQPLPDVQLPPHRPGWIVLVHDLLRFGVHSDTLIMKIQVVNSRSLVHCCNARIETLNVPAPVIEPWWRQPLRECCG